MLRAAGALSISGAAGATYGVSWANRELGEDAVERISNFYGTVIPMILEYKSLEFQCETLPSLVPFGLVKHVSAEDEAKLFEPLHEKWKQPVVDKFMELGGFYYKNGQRAAGNMGGFVPPVWQKAMQPFLDKIPPRPFHSVIVPIIESELGVPLGEIFSSMDPEPLGCASIGQAHRAVLRANGERVVIKVQDPRAEKTFRGDVLALKTLTEAFFPQATPAFTEMERQFATEFDYRREAENGRIVRANLAKGNQFPRIVVPEVYPELCTKRVLVMEEIYPSVPLTRALENQAAAAALHAGFEGTAADYMEAEKRKAEAAATAAAACGQVVDAVDASTLGWYISWQRLKLCARRWVGLGIWGGPDDVFVPMNVAQLVDDLLAVHGHEVLIDGTFNADPHPGKITRIHSDSRDSCLFNLVLQHLGLRLGLVCSTPLVCQ